MKISAKTTMPKNKDNDQEEQNQTLLDKSDMGFIYKSLINRGPTKRKIKPVESILNSFQADIGDSESDDSDYEPTNLEEDDVEIESDSDDENAQKDSKEEHKENGEGSNSNKSSKRKSSEDLSSHSSDSSSSDSDSSSSSSSSSSSNDKSNVKKNLPKTNCQAEGSKSGVVGAASEACSLAQPKAHCKASYDKIRICSVCLGDVSRSYDEIVECDACGISVHELCYGITADDAESIHSDASSASTEPWFCDPCKAGVRNPLCELCPNFGGIFKITDSGRWVHMVCALFTNGITFVDVERLRGPVISEIHTNRWGTKLCFLCEDQRFAQTGVCMRCDAGMCKTFFHVTCAQREGWLCLSANSDEPDPYIAYCKLHSDKQSVKQKKNNFLALMAKNKFNKNLKNKMHVEDEISNQRILTKLFKQRDKFQNTFRDFETINPATSRRIAKYLDSSPSVIRRLSNKGEIMGLKTRNAPCQEDYSDIRKKWYVPAAFSCEFVSYYIDRNDRIKEMQERSQELIKQNKDLKLTETNIRASYDKILENNNRLDVENERLRAKIKQYLTLVKSFKSKTEDGGLGTWAEKVLNLPEMTASMPGAHVQQLTSSQSAAEPGATDNFDPAKKMAKLRSRLRGAKEAAKQPAPIKECATCHVIKEQHLLALCDSCDLYYHLHCLDPPLRRMPKKTRFGGWQCSNCTEKAQDEEEERNEQNNSDFSYSNLGSVSPSRAETSDGGQNSGRSGARKLRENPKAATKYEQEETPATPAPTRGRPRGTKRGGLSKRGRKPRSLMNNATPAPAKETNSSLAQARKRRLSSSQDRTTEEEMAANGLSSTLLSPGQSEVESAKLASSQAKRSSVTVLCAQCKLEAQQKLSVKCDNCENNYHFACLVPPCTKSPKRRGYTWCCYVCEKTGEKRETSHQEQHEQKKKIESDQINTKKEVEDINDIESKIVLNDLKASVVLASNQTNGIDDADGGEQQSMTLETKAGVEETFENLVKMEEALEQPFMLNQMQVDEKIISKDNEAS